MNYVRIAGLIQPAPPHSNAKQRRQMLVILALRRTELTVIGAPWTLCSKRAAGCLFSPLDHGEIHRGAALAAAAGTSCRKWRHLACIGFANAGTSLAASSKSAAGPSAP
jgi:hypothetical protein